MQVELKNVKKEYKGCRILDIDKLEFSRGNIYAVLGCNGSGKTTLVECIAGLLKPDAGEILYDGQWHSQIAHGNIAMMTQKPYLFNKNVLENILSGLRFRRLSDDVINNRLEKYLSFFNMQSLLHKNAKKLSGGEAAKTALLRTAIIENKLTILDEPTASMDINSTLLAEDLMRTMVSLERTVILVTHDLFQAQRVANKVIFMDAGKIIEQGNKDKVFSNPRHEIVKMMLNRY